MTADHQVIHDQWGVGAVVVLCPVRHGRFPKQGALRFIQCNHVGIVGEHEDPVVCHGYAAVHAQGGIAGQAFSTWSRPVPDLASCTGIQGP